MFRLKCCQRYNQDVTGDVGAWIEKKTMWSGHYGECIGLHHRAIGALFLIPGESNTKNGTAHPERSHWQDKQPPLQCAFHEFYSSPSQRNGLGIITGSAVDDNLNLSISWITHTYFVERE